MKVLLLYKIKILIYLFPGLTFIGAQYIIFSVLKENYYILMFTKSIPVYFLFLTSDSSLLKYMYEVHIELLETLEFVKDFSEM